MLMLRAMILMLMSGAQSPISRAIACPAAALYCFELLPPPELPGIHGSVELQPINTPFGVAVTSNGAPRYRLVAQIAGLPAPRTLGAYKAYVAWAYTITMDSAIKVGVVGDGRVPLGEIAREQFRVLITAEPAADVRERSGRIVLRGTSP